MYIYIGLMCLILLAIFRTHFGKRNKKYLIKLSHGEAKVEDIDKAYFCAILLVLWLLLCLKSETVGNDTTNYQRMYDEAKYYLNGLQFRITNQPLYYVIFGTLKMVGIPFRTAQVLFYTGALAVVAYFVFKYSRQKVLTIYFFVTCETMAFYMSGLRQMLAITFGLLAFDAIFKGRKLASLCLVGIAIGIHTSAIVLLLPLILNYYVPTRQQVITIALVVWGTVLLTPTQLIFVVANRLGFSNYAGEFGMSSNPLLLLVYAMIGGYVIYVLLHTRTLEREQRVLLSLFVIGLSFVFLSVKFYLLTRLFYYYQLPIYIVMANSFDRLTANKRNSAFFLVAIMLFLIFFVFSLRNDAAGIFPYNFYWSLGEGWK